MLEAEGEEESPPKPATKQALPTAALESFMLAAGADAATASGGAAAGVQLVELSDGEEQSPARDREDAAGLSYCMGTPKAHDQPRSNERSTLVAHYDALGGDDGDQRTSLSDHYDALDDHVDAGARPPSPASSAKGLTRQYSMEDDDAGVAHTLAETPSNTSLELRYDALDGGLTPQKHQVGSIDATATVSAFDGCWTNSRGNEHLIAGDRCALAASGEGERCGGCQVAVRSERISMEHRGVVCEGRLAADRHQILWTDGDVWDRTIGANMITSGSDADIESVKTADLAADTSFNGSWVSSTGNSHFVAGNTCIVDSDVAGVVIGFFKTWSRTRCVLGYGGKEYRGELLQDGRCIRWSDGDEWARTEFSPDEPAMYRELRASSLTDGINNTSFVLPFVGIWISCKGNPHTIFKDGRCENDEGQSCVFRALCNGQCELDHARETYRGELSDNGAAITWMDGDVWRVSETMRLQGPPSANVGSAETASTTDAAKACASEAVASKPPPQQPSSEAKAIKQTAAVGAQHAPEVSHATSFAETDADSASLRRQPTMAQSVRKEPLAWHERLAISLLLTSY